MGIQLPTSGKMHFKHLTCITFTTITLEAKNPPLVQKRNMFILYRQQRTGEVTLGWKQPISNIQLGKLLPFTWVHSVRGLTVAIFRALRLSAGFSFEARGRTFRPVVHYAMSGTLVSYNYLQISLFVCYFSTWSCVGAVSLISENCLWGKDLCPQIS